MEELAKELMEELNCETAFTIPLLGGIPIAESVVVTWVIMAILVILSICMTRNLKVENPSRRQVVVEFCVTWLQNLVKGFIGEEGTQYVPYLVTVIVYIGFSNVIGLFGMKPPTKDMNVTAALALMSIVLIEYSGIHAKGWKKWAKKKRSAEKR